MYLVLSAGSYDVHQLNVICEFHLIRLISQINPTEKFKRNIKRDIHSCNGLLTLYMTDKQSQSVYSDSLKENE